MATIADVNQDIIGWDFIAKYRLNFEWTNFGDIELFDKRAGIRIPVRHITVPSSALLRAAAIHDKADWIWSPEDSQATAFEIASMKALGNKEEGKLEEIPERYRELINKYPEILNRY